MNRNLRILKCFSFIFLVFLLNLHNGHTQKWKEYAKAKPPLEKIEFYVQGKKLNLKDDIDVLYQYYINREIDAFLDRKIQTQFTSRYINKGLDLRKSKVKFANFPIYKVPEDLSWDENPFTDRNWQWSLHQLSMIPYLLAAYDSLKDDWYLKKAQNITLDWINDNVKKEFPSKLSWHDHATAIRLKNIMYLFEYSRKIETTNELVSSLLTAVYIHCQVLSDPRFYSEFHNHGLYQSYILFLAGCVFPEFADAGKWKELGMKRTVSEISHAFTTEGIHIENSPGYHQSQLENIIKINQIFINYENKPICANIDEIINGAIEYLAYIIKPNRRFPLLGDTRYGKMNIKESLSYYNFLPNYAYYQYSFSQGENGEKPLQADKVYKKSGYAIFRNKWHNVQNFQETVYLAFKAGFLSKAHKHSDDLSFVLYGYGEDWIVDAGLFQYQNSAFRDYVRSNKAHNLVIINNLNLPRSPEYIDKSRLDSFELSDKYVYASGSHELYTGFKVKRKIEYYKPSKFYISDEVNPSNEGEYNFKILFHVPMNKEIKVKRRKVYIISRRTKKL